MRVAPASQAYNILWRIIFDTRSETARPAIQARAPNLYVEFQAAIRLDYESTSGESAGGGATPPCASGSPTMMSRTISSTG